MEQGKIVTTLKYTLRDHVKGGLTEKQLTRLAAGHVIQRIQHQLNDVHSSRLNRSQRFATDLHVVNSPYDSALVDSIEQTVDDLNRVMQPRHLIVAGIGGSELGSTAVISACNGNPLEYNPITSLNNAHVQEIMDGLDLERTVVMLVSRSGTTKESLTAYEAFKSYMATHLGTDAKNHLVAVLGNDKTEHDLIATDAAHTKVKIVPSMSGRYTALHAANMLTMKLCGVDILKVQEGAREMVESVMQSTDVFANQALAVAAAKYILNTQYGKTIWHTGVFSPNLVKYGDWLDQLTEESLGHNPRIDISTKTTELSNKLHSDFQNWIAGKNKFYHQFVFPTESAKEPILNPAKAAETLEDIEAAAYLGTVQALAKKGRPSYTTFMTQIDARAMGALLMRDMLATIYLGELYGLAKERNPLNPKKFLAGKGYFNQPGVQEYKAIMGNLLENLPQLRYLRTQMPR